MGKRRTAFLIAGVLAAAALTGCGGASGEKTGAKEKVRLMVWSSSEDQSKDSGQWLQNSCEDFAELHPEWDITFVYGIADEATAANQVAQDPEASADVFMYANDTLTIMTDANALTKFGGRYREEIETTNSPEVLESLVKDGDLYGVPFTTNMIRVFFLRRILKTWIPCLRRERCLFRLPIPGIFLPSILEMAVPFLEMEQMNPREWILAEKKQQR